MDTMKVNWAIRMASTGYYKSFTPSTTDVGDYATRGPVGNIGTDTLNVLLNNAPASYPGAMFRFRDVRTITCDSQPQLLQPGSKGSPAGVACCICRCSMISKIYLRFQLCMMAVRMAAPDI